LRWLLCVSWQGRIDVQTMPALRELAREGKLTREVALEEEAARQQLIGQLVGQLYPLILWDEIHEIRGLARISEPKLPDPR
jgi:hypothetical protein